MTGGLYWAEGGEDRHRHNRVVFGYRDGELRFRDMRKLQGIRLVRDQHERDRVLGQLGPDALAISRDQLREVLHGMRRQVKVALMGQSVIAGLGNLLADEILWRARIHPKRRCVHIGADDLRRLRGAMRTVLRQSARHGRVPPRKSWLTGRRDEPSGSCPRCGARWPTAGSAVAAHLVPALPAGVTAVRQLPWFGFARRRVREADPMPANKTGSPRWCPGRSGSSPS